MKILLVAFLLFGFSAANAGTVKCENLSWKLVERDGSYGKYRGKVSTEVDAIHIELRNSSRVIGQGSGFPNPGGSWEVAIFADYKIKRSHKPKFYCEKY